MNCNTKSNTNSSIFRHCFFCFCRFYADEHLKWDNPPKEDCLSIDLSATLPLNLQRDARRASHLKYSRVYNILYVVFLSSYAEYILYLCISCFLLQIIHFIIFPAFFIRYWVGFFLFQYFRAVIIIECFTTCWCSICFKFIF